MRVVFLYLLTTKWNDAQKGLTIQSVSIVSKKHLEPVGHTNGHIRVPVWMGYIMLIITSAVWGGGYTFADLAMDTMSLQWVMAIRLTFGAIAVGLITMRRIRRIPVSQILIPALLLGITYWAAYLVQMKGLELTAPGRNSFLTATYCVVVPFVIWVMLHKRPTAQNLVAATVCLVGVGFVSLNGGSSLAFNAGDLVSLAGGVLFGINIALSGMLAKVYDAMTLTFYEFAISAVLFIGGALLFEPMPQANWFTPTVTWSLLYLVVLSTIVGQSFQNVAFACVPSAQGSLILCTESLFGVLFSVFITGEQVTAMMAIGFILIFASIILSEFRLPQRKTAISQ